MVGQWSVVIGGLFCLLWAAPLHAAEVDTKLALPLFLKMVSYDESFTARKKPDTLRVYFLYDYADSKSYQQYQDAREYFRTTGGVTVAGVPVKLTGIQKHDADSIIRSGPDSSYAVVVCASGRGQEFRELTATFKAKNCHSFAIDCSDLAYGVAVTVEAKEYRTAIVVSLRSATAEGSHFSASILSLCTVVDKPS